MSLEKTIRVIAGVLILVSLVAAHYISSNWYYFTAFIGVNLIQSAFTNWCLMETMLKKAFPRFR
ncbi:MAG: YgaP family membrane protein [Flavobacteriaceae bacterium]